MAAQCLAHQQVTFIGDSTSRQLYDHLVHELALTHAHHDEPKHSDKASHDAVRALSLRFKWDPYLNTTDVDALDENEIVVLGTGLWYLRYANVQSWSAMMDRLFAHSLPYNTLLIPVLHPEMGKLSHERRETITDEDVDAMNDDLAVRWQNSSHFDSNINIPFALNAIMGASPNETNDGLHYSSKVLHQATQLLLNYWCNDLIVSNNVSCCRPYPAPRPLQLLCLALVALVAVAKPIQSAFAPNHPRQHLLAQASILAGVLMLAYLADRSHLFAKSPKEYNAVMVSGLFVLIVAIGYKTMAKNEDDKGVLNRSQTDELKGAMQLIILIYHYFSGSKLSQFYIPVRILVAAYLFLLGYGNGMYFLKNPPTLPRYIAVMLRYNLLTMALCYVLDGQYISYYFVPIITIWFTVLWISFYINSQINSNLKLLCIKLLISFSLFAVLLNIPYVNAVIPYEYKFRLNLDILAPYSGTFLAIWMHNTDNRERWINKYSISVSGFVFVSMVVLDTLITPIKYSYNQYHMLISPVVVLACLVLRNCTQLARSYHSTLLAKLGRCSLELFVLQFHLLLAGDSKGLLILLPNTSKLLNLVLALAMFIPISMKVNQISNYFVGLVVAFVTPQSFLPLSKSPNPSTVSTLSTKASKRRQLILISGVAFTLSFTKLFY